MTRNGTPPKTIAYDYSEGTRSWHAIAREMMEIYRSIIERPMPRQMINYPK